MIQEYRKTSAETLGNEMVTTISEGLCMKINGQFIPWQPDKDANQMLMVWEWLRKQKRTVAILEIIDEYIFFDETLFDATMKAFMEYIEVKK